MILTSSIQKGILPFLLASVFLQSCAFYNGTMTGNAAISDANFTVAGFASGTARCTYVFGIGGLKKDGLVLEAKRNMYNTYPLAPGQAFANVTVDFKRGYYILFARTVCTITADIIDFNEMPSSNDFDSVNSEITANVINQLKNYSVGEHVYYSESNSSAPIGATITSFLNGKAQIRFAKQKGILDHKIVKLSDLYKISNDSSLVNIDPIYQIGDSVYFTSSASFEKLRGQIFALGYQGACIVYDKNNEKHAEIVNRIDFRTMKTMTMEENKNNLQGSWELAEIGTTKIVKNSKTPIFKVNAHDLKFTGFGGCNRYFGSFTVTRNGCTTGPIGATRMACLDENIEAEYLKALGSQDFKIKRTATTLTLKSETSKLIFNFIEE